MIENKPSFWTKCGDFLLMVTPILTGIVTIAAPIIECKKHDAKNRSNVRAEQQLMDMRYYDWQRRQEYRRQHPYRNTYRRRRYGKR